MNLKDTDFLDYLHYSLNEIIFKYINYKNYVNLKVLLVDIEILIEDYLCTFKIKKEKFKLNLFIRNNSLFFDIGNDYTYYI
jgi:hypothetical protein